MANKKEKGVETKEKNRKEKNSIFSRIGKFFSSHSNGAKKATVVLFVMILLCIISGIFVCYLAVPAKEIYVSESQMTKEIRNIYQYEIGSDERASQEARAQDAQDFYGSIMDNYLSDSNAVISGYAGIQSNFIKGMIALVMVLPFIGIVLMFLGSPVNFIFAVINMVFVIPFQTAKYLFLSFKSDKKEKKVSKHQQLKAA